MHSLCTVPKSVLHLCDLGHLCLAAEPIYFCFASESPFPLEKLKLFSILGIQLVCWQKPAA